MQQSSVSAREPITLGPVDIALIEGAARGLEDFSDEIRTCHWPSWGYPQLPDGLAVCVSCWRPIAALHLGMEPCPGARRGRLAEYLK